MKLYLLTRSAWILISIGSLLINACGTPPTESAPPPPQPIRVSFTPALRPLLKAVSVCALQQPEIAIVVNEVPAAYLDIYGSDLSLRLSYPTGSEAYSAPLSMEEIVIIVNPANPVEIISQADAVALFTGRITNWSEVEGYDLEVEVWFNLINDDVHQIFQDGVLEDKFPTTLAKLAPDPAAMITSVASNPAALGYLPRSWLSSEVKPVEIVPSVTQALTHPVLALTPEKPQDEIRVLLHCLQNGIGQQIIQEIYP